MMGGSIERESNRLKPMRFQKISRSIPRKITKREKKKRLKKRVTNLTERNKTNN